MNKGRFICVFVFFVHLTCCAGVQKPMQESLHAPVVPATVDAVSDEKAKTQIVDPVLYYNYLMAQVYQTGGDIENAIPCYKIALSFDPDSILLRFDLATLYVHIGRLGEAKQECLEIIRKDPSYLSAHLLLAGIYSHSNVFTIFPLYNM